LRLRIANAIVMCRGACTCPVGSTTSGQSLTTFGAQEKENTCNKVLHK
jgi:hypothetical protein